MSKACCKSSISLTEPVREAALIRMKALQYESFAAYIVGLIRADIITGPPHELPQRIARMSERQRDKIDAALVSQAAVLVDEIEAGESAEDIIAVAEAYRTKRKQTTPAQPSNPKRKEAA